MTKIAMALQDLHDAEQDLVLDLERMAEKHHADHGVVHVTRDLVRWSADHIAQIAAVASRYGADLPAQPRHTFDLAAAARRKTGELMGRRHEEALTLIDDLRDLYGAAARVQLDYEVLGQAAQALQDTELVALTERCRAQTQRQVEWAEGALKELAAQALVTP